MERNTTTNFTGNLNRNVNANMFFIIEEAKEIILNFFTWKCESTVNLFYFNITAI